MAEVGNGVTGQDQSFDVLRNNHYYEDHAHRDYHDEDHDDLYIYNDDDENLVVSHVGWMPCVAFNSFAQI